LTETDVRFRGNGKVGFYDRKEGAELSINGWCWCYFIPRGRGGASDLVVEFASVM